MTTAELLAAWRDAIRAAELAERLAVIAADAAGDADFRAKGSAEIAKLAERAAAAATRAADRARAAASEAAGLAQRLDADRIARSDDVARLHTESEQAGSAYHEAEAETRSRQDGR